MPRGWPQPEVPRTPLQQRQAPLVPAPLVMPLPRLPLHLQSGKKSGGSLPPMENRHDTGNARHFHLLAHLTHTVRAIYVYIYRCGNSPLGVATSTGRSSSTIENHDSKCSQEAADDRTLSLEKPWLMSPERFKVSSHLLDSSSRASIQEERGRDETMRPLTAPL